MALIKIKQIKDLQAAVDLANSAVQDLSGLGITADAAILNGLDGKVTANANAITAIENTASTLDGKVTANANAITALEAVIMEDNEELEEVFFTGGLNYTVSSAIQDDNKLLVKAFVNGIKVEVESVDKGGAVVLVNPGYEIDNTDKVAIFYQSATVII